MRLPMDAHAWVEEMSRDLFDAEEALEVCDPDEPMSVGLCLSQMHILHPATRGVREGQREHRPGRPC
ncbi:MAG: hypothetical protein EOO61_14640, partial [Hymenobacter sp.]